MWARQIPRSQTANGRLSGGWLSRALSTIRTESLVRRATGRCGLTQVVPSVDQEWQQTTRSFLTHDVRVNEALLRGVHDPVLRVALGMRQLHTFVAAVQAWSTARSLHSEGWKKDIARLADADPVFFDVIERWLAASDFATRHEIFCEVVAQALGPLGGPLPEDTLLPQVDEVWEALNIVMR